MKNFKAAVLQNDAGPDVLKNLERAGELVERATAEGAELLVLPERFNHYARGDRPHAEPEDGPALRWLAEAALRHRVHLGGGLVLEGEGGRAWNAFALFGPDGRRLALYRKIHLFKLDLPSLSIDESRAFHRGRDLVVAETPLGRIGLSICYDLRFPELYRGLRAAGAEIVVVPACFTATTGRAHWATLVRARAIEDQVYVLAAGQVGDHQGAAEASFGHSQILDPWGETLASLGGDETGVAVAALSAERLETVRRQLPCWEHRVL